MRVEGGGGSFPQDTEASLSQSRRRGMAKERPFADSQRIAWLSPCFFHLARKLIVILFRFEVVAVNKEGESPAAKTKEPVSAENPYSAPGEPTDLRITDYDEKSVTLRWAKPRDILNGHEITFENFAKFS